MGLFVTSSIEYPEQMKEHHIDYTLDIKAHSLTLTRHDDYIQLHTYIQTLLVL